MKKIYDNNYTNQNLIIPGEIWNDRKVNGIQKMILALVKRMTKDGTQTVEALTLMMAQIMATHEKDIKYNLNELNKKGYIVIFKDPVSKSGFSIKYNAPVKAPQASSNDTSSLF